MNIVLTHWKPPFPPRIAMLLALALPSMSFACIASPGSDSEITANIGTAQQSLCSATDVALIPAMTGNTAPSGTVTRSGVYSSSYEAWKAFDGTTSIWLSNMYTSSVWIGYDWGGGAPKIVNSYKIKYANGSCCEQRGPKNWTLQGWNGSAWITVDTVTNQSGWYSNGERTYTVDTPGSYSKYRINVTADNYNNATYPITLVSIAEIQLYGTDACDDFSQTILNSGTNWQKQLVSGYAVDDNGAYYSEPIYVLSDSTGVSASPLPSDIKYDILYDLIPGDAVYSVSADIVDEIVLSEQIGALTPALQEIAEPFETAPLPDAQQYMVQSGSQPQNGWFGKCSDKLVSRTKSVNVATPINTTKSLGGGFVGTLSTTGDVNASATFNVALAKKRFKLFGVCIPYAIRFKSAGAYGSVQVSPEATATGSVSYENSWEFDIAKPGLGSINFFVGPIPVHIPLSLPISMGVDIDAQLTGSVSYHASQAASGTFDYTCTLKGCSGSSAYSLTGAQAPTFTGSIQARIEPSIWVQAGLRAALYNEGLAYAQIGVRPYARGDFWAYHGTDCGDANDDGTNEMVDAGTFDLDWQVHLTGEASAFGSGPTKWNDLWHTSRKHIGFWDLIGSNALQPMLGGSSTAMPGVSQTFSAEMRPCWPYSDAVSYKLNWGDGSASYASGAPQSSTLMSKAWPSVGAYSLGLTAQTDTHGRTLNGTVNRTVQVSLQQPPTTSLNLWLRADAGITSSNGFVSAWADQSGNNNTATMATASRQPSVVAGALNSKPVLRFGGAQSMVLTNLLKPTTFTVFVVGKNSQPSETFSMILGPAGNSANNQLRWENGSQLLFVGTGNGMPVVTSTIGNTRVYHALSARYNGSQMEVYRDGNLISTPSSFVTNGTWDLYQIGAWYSSYFMVGDVAEILFYFSALSESDRGLANSYLKNKYALP